MDNGYFVIALTGSPHVGKSTIFSNLTGMCRHGWSCLCSSSVPAAGTYQYSGTPYLLTDLPGTYSLSPRSRQGADTLHYFSTHTPDAIAVVCDGSCLEKGLYLLKEIVTMEKIQKNATPLILCLNFWDEAEKRGIIIDLELLQDVLQIPVVPCCAHCKTHLDDIKAAIHYSLQPSHKGQFYYQCLDFSPERLARECVSYTKRDYRLRDASIDRVVTAPVTGGLLLLLVLFVLFWLSAAGAGYLWAPLSKALSLAEQGLLAWMNYANAPLWLIQCLLYGIFRAMAWVITMMLPPLVFFFPLYTILEKSGYLARAALIAGCSVNSCYTCAGQCVTMALIPSFLAAGITDSFTMSLVTGLWMIIFLLLGISSTFGIYRLLSPSLLKGGPFSNVPELPPYRLSHIPRSMIQATREQTLCFLNRSVLTAVPAGFLLWFLANMYYTGPGQGYFSFYCTVSAAPSLLSVITGFLDPAAQLLGLDGIILAALFFSFPASELFLPILFIMYLQTGAFSQAAAPFSWHQLLAAHGWTWHTVLCTLSFILFYQPCRHACHTIFKTTGKRRWAAASILLPAVIGAFLSILITAGYHLIAVL